MEAVLRLDFVAVAVERAGVDTDRCTPRVLPRSRGDKHGSLDEPDCTATSAPKTDAFANRHGRPSR